MLARATGAGDVRSSKNEGAGLDAFAIEAEPSVEFHGIGCTERIAGNDSAESILSRAKNDVHVFKVQPGSENLKPSLEHTLLRAE